MVESSNRAKINFIKLKTEELSAKIALLVSNGSRVIFWKNAPRYQEGFATHFDVSQETTITISKSTTLLKLINERVCINFSINEIEYFIRGVVVEQTNDLLKVELSQDCFRVEKRSKERLITYPIHEVYVYFRYELLNSKNVVLFNRKEQENKSFFTEIDNYKKNKILNLNADLKLSDDEDIVGFRVEDISSNGLSFFANSKEKDLILDKIENQKQDLMLNFDMEIFTLENTQIVYKINYINAQFAGVPMFKVGLSFTLNQNLKNKIEKLIGAPLDLADYQREFEEFIKNE